MFELQEVGCLAPIGGMRSITRGAAKRPNLDLRTLTDNTHRINPRFIPYAG